MDTTIQKGQENLNLSEMMEIETGIEEARDNFETPGQPEVSPLDQFSRTVVATLNKEEIRGRMNEYMYN